MAAARRPSDEGRATRPRSAPGLRGVRRRPQPAGDGRDALRREHQRRRGDGGRLDAGHHDAAVARRVADAVAQGRFGAMYRPVFEVGSGRVVGADASADWRRFHDADRDASMVVDHLLDLVLADHATGPAADADWWVRVVLDADHLVDRRFIAHLAGRIDAVGLSPSRVRIGVREADLALTLVAGGLGHIGEAGLLLDVTDFGMASLCPSALRKVSIGSLRVNLDGFRAGDRADVVLVSSVVEVAASLGIEVVATEIEGDDELALVHEAGVQLVQGYRWGAPGPLANLLTASMLPG